MKKILSLKFFCVAILSLCFLKPFIANAQNLSPPLPTTVNAPTINPATSSDVQQKVQRLQQLLALMQQQGAQNTANANAMATTPMTSLAATPAAPINVAPSQQPQQGGQQTPNATAAEEEQQPDLYDEAFTGVVNQLFPMAPEQIVHLKETFHDAQRAAAAPTGIPPRPTSSSILVDLAPKATPPVIRLQAGYITSLVFVDSTGQPWPIFAYSLGDPSAFNIQWDKKGNTLLVQSVTFYKRSNLAVMLKGLNTPVMMTLLPGQEAVDYRVDLRVPGLGPNAVLVQNGLPESTNPMLVDVLNGIPPANSTTLRVSGGNCQAWLTGKTLFLRTNLTIVSPAWKSVITSIDGMHAYELQPTPVVLASEHGKNETITLKLEGFE